MFTTFSYLFREKMRKLEKVRESSGRLEKVGEGWRRLLKFDKARKKKERKFDNIRDTHFSFSHI